MDQGPTGDNSGAGGPPPDATSVTPGSPSPDPRQRRRRLLIGIGTAVAIVALVSGIVVGAVTGGDNNAPTTSTTRRSTTTSSAPTSSTSSTTAPSSTTSTSTTTTSSTTTTTAPDTKGPTISNVVVDPSVVYENGPACGSRPTDASISVSASDPSGVASVTVTWSTGSATLHQAGSAWIGTVGPFPVGTAPPSGSKPVALQITATDKAGNASQAHSNVTVTSAALC